MSRTKAGDIKFSKSGVEKPARSVL